MKKFTLSKKDRLKSRKLLSLTFSEGKSIQAYPVRAFFTLAPEDTGQIKIAFAVPKKHFRRAVDRNRIKRLLREAYRLNQYVLKENWSGENGLNIVFLYYPREILPFQVFEKAAIKLLRRLARELKDCHD